MAAPIFPIHHSNERRSTVTIRDLSRQSKEGYDKGRSRVWQAAWIVFSFAFFQKWWFPLRLRPLALRFFGAHVEDHVYIRHGVRIHWPWKLSIGAYAQIGDDAWIMNLEPVSIGRSAVISQQAALCTGSHKHWSETFEYDNAPITVGEGAWVTMRSVVLRGVEVPAGALVPAGAIIRRSAELEAFGTGRDEAVYGRR
jgi:putative colanic acid biosynthesis acetyltransferase WcaF